jgi:hypothetical protein
MAASTVKLRQEGPVKMRRLQDAEADELSAGSAALTKHSEQHVSNPRRSTMLMSATPGEELPQTRCRSRVSLIAPTKGSDYKRHAHSGHERAKQDIAAQQICHRNAGQDRVRQRVPKEGHSAQHDVGADDRAQDADHQGGQHSALHKE